MGMVNCILTDFDEKLLVPRAYCVTKWQIVVVTMVQILFYAISGWIKS